MCDDDRRPLDYAHHRPGEAFRVDAVVKRADDKVEAHLPEKQTDYKACKETVVKGTVVVQDVPAHDALVQLQDLVVWLYLGEKRLE